MKRILLALGLIVLLTVPAHAQWASGEGSGPTTKHRIGSTQEDDWWLSAGNGYTPTALNFGKHTKVRADYDLTGTGARASVNLQCSNGSIWLSGDSIAVTADSYATYNLMGCRDYNMYIESLEGTGASFVIYMTPYTGEYNGE